MAYLEILIIVLTMMVYLSFGFVLVKWKKGSADHAKTLSAILVYILAPAMIINSFLRIPYTKEMVLDIGLFFVVSLAVQFLFMMILYLILRRKSENPKYRILTVTSVLGNVGFFGLPAVCAVFPDYPVVACYSSMYVISMNLLVFTFGTFLITKDKRFVSLKSAILNPTTISFLVAIPLFFFGVRLPDAVMDPLGLLVKMVTPVCMITLGMRLATLSFASLFRRPFVYAAAFLKLIAYPLFAFLCVAFLPGISDVFRMSLLILSAAPSGAIIVSLSELYGCERELSANAVLVITLFSVLTMPLLMLIFM